MRSNALSCAVQVSPTGSLLSGHLDIPALVSLKVLAAAACEVFVVTCLFVLQVGLALLWPSI